MRGDTFCSRFFKTFSKVLVAKKQSKIVESWILKERSYLIRSLKRFGVKSVWAGTKEL